MIAAKERTSPEKVLLYLKESLIKDDDTPQSIEYTVADIIGKCLQKFIFFSKCHRIFRKQVIVVGKVYFNCM